MVRTPPYESLSVAPEATLAHTGNFGKGYPLASLSPSTSRLVVKREQCASGPTVSSPLTSPSNVYRRLKRRLGNTLRGFYCKRRLVRHKKSSPLQLPGDKSSFPGPQEFQASLQGPDCSDSNRQHKCSLLHQQRGEYEIRLSLCCPMETPVLVSPQRYSSAARHIPGWLNVIADQLSRHRQETQ